MNAKPQDNGDARLMRGLKTSLRGRGPKQSIFASSGTKDGLLRCARNDGGFWPGVSEHHTGLEAVKDAARRYAVALRAILDRFSPRAILNTAGTEKRPFWPNRETLRMESTMRWLTLLTSLLLMLALANRCECRTLPPEVKADPSISQLVPLDSHSGANDVIFWGTSEPMGGGLPFHQAGKIYQFETQGVIKTYYATMPWISPSYVIPLEDGPPPCDGNDSCKGNYVGNMDINTTVGKVSDTDPDILIQHIAFFQGLLKGKKQTFFVLAQMQNTALDDLAAWFRSRPVEIDIFAFSGSDPNPGYNPPGFEPLDSLTTKYNYCDAEYATLAVLPIEPPPLKQLHDLQALGKPSLQKQICRN